MCTYRCRIVTYIHVNKFVDATTGFSLQDYHQYFVEIATCFFLENHTSRNHLFADEVFANKSDRVYKVFLSPRISQPAEPVLDVFSKLLQWFSLCALHTHRWTIHPPIGSTFGILLTHSSWFMTWGDYMPVNQLEDRCWLDTSHSIPDLWHYDRCWAYRHRVYLYTCWCWCCSWFLAAWAGISSLFDRNCYILWCVSLLLTYPPVTVISAIGLLLY